MEPVETDRGSMKKLITPQAGLLLVVVGVLLLVVSFVARISAVNALLLAALFLIICGIVVYVAAQKMASRY